MARRALIAPVIVFAVVCSAMSILTLNASAQNNPNKLWEDFIHYSRIARLDLAASSGKALVALKLEPEALLKVIETGPYSDWQLDLVRLQRMDDAIASVGKEVDGAIENARIAVSRDPARVRETIDKLDDGARPRLRATRRLQFAGQYAAPELLNVLRSRSPENEALHPYVIEAMVAIGQPIVSPLSEALSGLPPVTRQQVAEVLSRIGYPLALPYLKDAATQSDTTEETRSVLMLAFNNIASQAGVSGNLDAADLYLKLANDYYALKEGLILEPDAATNLYWMYDKNTGLTSLSVPTPVFHDVQAMRTARRTLQLDSNKSAAYSLWIAANLRRENNLPEGQKDPSYSAIQRSPMFYAELSGPNHMHPVLNRAMADRDAELALDAIAAIASTAGAKTAIHGPSNSEITGSIQPLIGALNYPDRRVRYQAAYAIAKAKPTEDFNAADRVVGVLADAVREEGKQFALVLADNVEQMNARASSVKSAGKFDVLQGSTIEDSMDQINGVPGIDLIVIETKAIRAQELLAQVKAHHKLSGTPTVLLLEAGEVPRAQRLLRDDPLVHALSIETDPAQIIDQFKLVHEAHNGTPLTKQAAIGFSLQSLAVLRDLALDKSDNQVFKILNAKPTLLESLNDTRKEVVLATAEVLALINQEDVQQAIADAALQSSRGATVQVDLLKSLGHSARLHGNKITNRQAMLLVKLVEDSTGKLADAAAGAHGSLNLPTSQGIKLITD